jgi:hypothetical protein
VSERIGNWMQTFTGKAFYPLDPRPEEIEIADIGHALSQLCRYGGHTRQFYSVAEHCVLMSHTVAPEHALWALLHDATEAYVGDVIRPLKGHLPEYVAVEDRLMAVIAERYGLVGTTMPAEVKEADNRILVNERDALMAAPPQSWRLEGLHPLPVEVQGWMPKVAEWAYLDRFSDLTHGLRGAA